MVQGDNIFAVMTLSQAVATSFCFSNPPKVSLGIDSSASKHRKKMRKIEGRLGFSHNHPYGHGNKIAADGNRQFVRH